MSILIGNIYEIAKHFLSINLAIQIAIGFSLFILSSEISKRIKMKIVIRIMNIFNLHSHNIAKQIKLYFDLSLRNTMMLIFLYISQIIFWTTESSFNILNIVKYILICDIIGKLTYKISEKKYYYYISIFITVPVILLYTDTKLFNRELDYAMDLILFKISIREVLRLLFTLTTIFLFNKKLINVFHSRINNAKITTNLKIILSKTATFGTHFIFGIIILKVLGFNLSGLTVFTGAVGVGIGIGLQKIAVNIISGFSIIADTSFTIGNYIEIDGIQGFIENINIKNVTLRLSDNRCLVIPNEKVITSKVINTNYVSNKHGKTSININISHHANTEKALEIIQNIITKNEFVTHHNDTHVFISGIVKCTSIVATFWVDDIVLHKSIASHNIMLNILNEFKKNDIELYREYQA
jgi:small-conductance mechanosensitive channel